MANSSHQNKENDIKEILKEDLNNKDYNKDKAKDLKFQEMMSREIAREMSREMEREMRRELSREIGREIIREKSREMLDRDMSKEMAKQMSRENSRERLSRDTSIKEMNMEFSRELLTSRENTREILKDGRVTNQEMNRDTRKDFNRETPNFVCTPLLDALTNSIPKIAHSISSSSVTPEVSPILSPALVNEFKTSLYVGSDFTSDDITVQLIDNFSGYKVSKKLFVHCFRIEPISNKSVTLTSGQLVAPTSIDLDLSNGTNYLRKELKKDIHIPNNADINTLESYLENGHLVIKCMLKKDNGNETLEDSRRSPVYSSTPVYSKSKLPKQSNILAEFEIKNCDNSKDLSPLEITINSRTSDSNDVSSNFIFENPLYNNSTIQTAAHQAEPSSNSNTTNNKSILKNGNDTNLVDHPAIIENNINVNTTYAPHTNQSSSSLPNRKARKIKELKRRETGLPMANNHSKEAQVNNKESRNIVEHVNRARGKVKNRQAKSEKRHYKSNEALNDRIYDKKISNTYENQNYDRAMSFVSNPMTGSKSVRFDINEKQPSSRRSESHKLTLDPNDNTGHQRHRSTSSKSRSNERLPTKRSPIQQQTSNSSPRIISSDSIQDGFNCITKDALDNIYLTYFFKLPSCSPSDRTQVRIEDNNVLKLKIIQEKNFTFKPKRSRSKSSVNSKKQHKFKNNFNKINDKNNLSATSLSATSASSSSSSLSSSSIIYESLNESCSCEDQTNRLLIIYLALVKTMTKQKSYLENLVVDVDYQIICLDSTKLV